MRSYLFLAVLLCPKLAAAGSLLTFDMPGAATTCGTAISSEGVVAGFGGGATFAQGKPFLFSNGLFTSPKVDLPGTVQIFGGLNHAGSIVGTYLSTTALAVGTFKFHAGQTTPMPLLTLTAITDSGLLLGQAARQPVQPLVWYDVGVILRKSGPTTVLDNGTGDIFPAGMDAHGEHVVGTSWGATQTQAWSYHRGRFTGVSMPGALPGSTSPVAVDLSGRISGTFYTGTTAAPVAHGFFLDGTTYTAWNVPGATFTEITGANQAGQVTGCFADATGTHGYVAVP